MERRSMIGQKRIDKYILGEVLGQGRFGTVYKSGVLDQDYQIQGFAVLKQISQQKISQELISTYEQEKNNQCLLSMHPNIAQFIESLKSTKNFYIVMEYCNLGDLRSYCKKLNYKFEEEKVQFIAAQLLSGLKVMRDFRIIHRDLKPENILLKDQFSQEVIKIGDLGLSRALQEGELAQTQCGTPNYTSPEILKYEDYDFKTDL